MKRNSNNSQAPIVLVAKQSATERAEIFSIVTAAEMTAIPVSSLKDVRRRLNESRPVCLVSDLATIERIMPEVLASFDSPRAKPRPRGVASRSATVVVSANLLRQRTAGPRGVALLGEGIQKKQLLRAIERTVAWDRRSRLRRLSRQQVAARAGQLSERDQQIMRMIYDGLSNKVIANRQDVGLRTVESARARIFQQMGVETAVDLVRVLALADFYEEADG